MRQVKKSSARAKKILSTHHHMDHSMANPDLAKHYGVPVYGHVSDAKRLPGFTNGLDEGDTVVVGEETARVLFNPCHTRGHVAYVFDEAKALFSGDMLFAAGCGRLFEGSPEMMYTALCEKLAALPDDMRVFCGHEYTEANLRFAADVDPDNEAVKRKLERVQAIRAPRLSARSARRIASCAPPTPKSWVACADSRTTSSRTPQRVRRRSRVIPERTLSEADPR